VRSATIETRRRLYLLARVVVARHYRRALTLTEVAAAVSSSPRQLQRAYAQFGETTFQEDLLARRMAVAAELLIEQRAIPVCDVARLVGYRQAPHFARAFRRRYGLSPARFREAASQASAKTALPRSRPAGEHPARRLRRRAGADASASRHPPPVPR
jgi:AraC family transcriptional regulator of adaptative response / methylphosphotriester-DNA alkyltransferase methyltransferase